MNEAYEECRVFWGREMFERRGWVSACAGILVVLACSAGCRGDLVIEVQDAQIPYGGSGYVDVLISSDSSDLLLAFSAKMNITPGASANGDLQFDAPGFDASTVTSPFSYVFLGDSAGYSVPVPLPYEANVSDITSSSSDVTVDGTKRLLARLAVTHVGGTSAAVGETFSIVFDADPLISSFLSSSSSATLASRGQDWTGTITIVTPEPSAGVVLLCAGAGVVLWRRRKRRSGC